MTLDVNPRQAAQWFARNGYRVLPLHSVTDAGACTCGKADCHSPGKHPFALLAPQGSRTLPTVSIPCAAGSSSTTG